VKIKDYKPKSEVEAVGWLMEEACEVVIAIGRCMRFGIDNMHEGRSNRQILLDEMNDLRNSLFESETWIARE
jgi:hypothetical protein